MNDLNNFKPIKHNTSFLSTQIKQHEKVFENAQLVILDSNIPLSTMEYVIKTAHRFGKPGMSVNVFYIIFNACKARAKICLRRTHLIHTF